MEGGGEVGADWRGGTREVTPLLPHHLHHPPHLPTHLLVRDGEDHHHVGGEDLLRLHHRDAAADGGGLPRHRGEEGGGEGLRPDADRTLRAGRGDPCREEEDLGRGGAEEEDQAPIHLLPVVHVHTRLKDPHRIVLHRLSVAQVLGHHLQAAVISIDLVVITNLLKAKVPAKHQRKADGTATQVLTTNREEEVVRGRVDKSPSSDNKLNILSGIRLVVLCLFACFCLGSQNTKKL